MKKQMFSWPLLALLAALGSLSSGCSTTDTVSSRFPQLEEKISGARAAGAEVYAPDPFKSAVSGLEAAKSAVASGDMSTASARVDEAMADADYAAVKAPTEQAKKEAIELKDEIQSLRQEIKRLSSLK